MPDINIPTILLIVAVIAYLVYSRRKKDDLISEWTQFAGAHDLEFITEKSAISGLYRGHKVWIGPEQLGRVMYTWYGAQNGVIFDTQIWIQVQNLSHLKLRHVTKALLKGENEFKGLLADSPQLQADFTALKTPNWIVRLNGTNMNYTQNGVEHDTDRLLNTLNMLCNLVDVIEALPANDYVEPEPVITPRTPRFQGPTPIQAVTVLNADPNKHPLSR